MGDDQNIETSQLQQTTCNYADIEITSKQSFFLWILLGLRNDGHPPGCRANILREIFHEKIVRLKKKKKIQKLQSVGIRAPPGFSLNFWVDKKTWVFSVTKKPGPSTT